MEKFNVEIVKGSELREGDIAFIGGEWKTIQKGGIRKRPQHKTMTFLVQVPSQSFESWWQEYQAKNPSASSYMYEYVKAAFLAGSSPSKEELIEVMKKVITGKQYDTWDETYSELAGAILELINKK